MASNAKCQKPLRKVLLSLAASWRKKLWKKVDCRQAPANAVLSLLGAVPTAPSKEVRVTHCLQNPVIEWQQAELRGVCPHATVIT